MDGIASLLHDVPQFKVLAKASDVLQAMDDIKALQPDLVITDISMGEKGGLELTRFIASEYPLIKVIVSVSYTHLDVYKRQPKASMKQGGLGA